MKYYAATNRYGTESSIGFANTWSVLVFESKASRDHYVDSATNISTRSIKRAEIPQYVDAPKSFSGMCRQICYDKAYDIPGYIGKIVVDWTIGGCGEPLNLLH